MHKVVDAFDNDFTFVDNRGNEMYVLTNKNAPNTKLILVNTDDYAENNWKEIIPEAEEPIQGVKIIGDHLFVTYLKNAYSLVKIFNLDGSFVKDMELPGIGSIGGFSGEEGSSDYFFSFSSYLFPPAIYKMNVNDFSYVQFKSSNVDFDPELYITEQKWYESKDGTKVPMFLTHRKDLKLDGNNPTLLYGYGGFNISLEPSFSSTRLLLLEKGGVFVVANIRGGGEFGEEWHKAGTLEQKQNVFDDFIAAAEYLINNKYTQPAKLAIEGGSNGGLLVGATLLQRPELFGVAFPRVGVLDMLRYHKFTIGWAWATDYGTSDDETAFNYLIKYSPVHNVKPANYPATMIMTADHDDRVVPAHSFKFGAELQKNQTGDEPILVRIERKAGHGAGKPISKVIDEQADMYSFLFYNMGINY
ncbi:MAG: prolyl oligopeptidase family serine peptidase [Saprospiraceae bacterium]